MLAPCGWQSVGLVGKSQKLMFVLGAAAILIAAALPASAQTWNQTWSDEFNGSGGAASPWVYDVGNNAGWGNNELENYQSGSLNANQTGGALQMQARKENVGGFAYTSARIKTQGTKSFGPYGKMEARTQGPQGQGLWP